MVTRFYFFAFKVQFEIPKTAKIIENGTRKLSKSCQKIKALQNKI